MLIAILLVITLLAPIIIYFAREFKENTPSMHWPKLAPMIHLTFEDKPPRMTGQRNGRDILVDLFNNKVRVSTQLARPSRLRIEIGPKEEVARRAGMVVPDPVMTGDSAFEEKYLARCSDKAAGLNIVDPALRQRILAQPSVEILGQGASAQWIIPEAKDPDTLEGAMDVLTVIAEEMERFPQ